MGGALLTLTLLPFEGKLVSDGHMQLEEYRGGKNLEKRLQEAVREAMEHGGGDARARARPAGVGLIDEEAQGQEA